MTAETNPLPQTRPVRIVVADDHPVYIEGFMFAMSKHKDVMVVGSANNGEELVQLAEELQPDVVFTDIQMPVMDGITAAKEIKKRFPYIYVIGISQFAEYGMITDMIDAGASGYMLKNEKSSEILTAIERVMNGQLHYSLEVSNKMVEMVQRTQYNPLKPANTPRLSEREMAVLKELCKGLSSKEIAKAMRIDVRSVDSARERIMEKTGCANSAAMAIWAVRNFIVKP